jgi:hypothetical protein
MFWIVAWAVTIAIVMDALGSPERRVSPSVAA